MNYLEIKEKCKHGYTAIIPGWKGYLDWNYSTDLIYFHNADYTMSQQELDNIINLRNDLYYII